MPMTFGYQIDRPLRTLSETAGLDFVSGQMVQFANSVAKTCDGRLAASLRNLPA